MGVGEQNEVDRAHVETEVERPQVFGARFRPALEHAAIDEKTRIAGLDQRARSGHFAGRAKETQAHRHFPRSLPRIPDNRNGWHAVAKSGIGHLGQGTLFDFLTNLGQRQAEFEFPIDKLHQGQHFQAERTGVCL